MIKNYKKLIQDLKVILSLEEVKQSVEYKLEDGTVINAESITVGNLVSDLDGNPVKEGEQTLEDGTIFLTDSDGIISEVKEKTEETTQSTEEKVEAEKQEIKYSVIKQISKWSLNVDQDSIEVGTLLTYSYEGSEETYNVASGEYELENGNLIIVDSDSKVVVVKEVTKDIVTIDTVSTSTESETDTQLKETLTMLATELVNVKKELKGITKIEDTKLSKITKSVNDNNVDSKKNDRFNTFLNGLKK